MTNILIKVGLILAVLVILFTGEQYIEGRGYDRAKAEATAALEAQKREAGEVLATETAKTRAAEESLRTFKLIQDNKDAQAQNTIAALSGRVRQLAGPAGRLRDPNAQGCGGSGSGTQSEAATLAPDRPGDGAEAGGLLSTELTGLLQRLAIEADAINTAYASCRADTLQVRALQP
jgi:hypothetical protein